MDQSLDPFEGRYGQLLEVKDIGSKEYITTEYSFTKRQPLRVVQGGATGWRWGPQRLHNEARALQLIVENTTIPVPKLLEFGKDSNGRYYVTMERIYGVCLSEIGKECRRPFGVEHVRLGECSTCQQIAQQNTDRFITEEVIPKLQSLTSKETGLEGFVLPPTRIIEMRDQDSWPVKRSKSNDYSFIHGDFARHNIMMNPITLQIEKVFDWEHAGYFPPQMELAMWRMIGHGYWDLYKDNELIDREVALITP
jgi:hypothetical protein